MAIEITTDQKIKKLSIINFVFYFFLFLLIAFILSYFILNFWQKRLNRELADLTKSLEKTPAEKALEEKILGSGIKKGYQEKINDFGKLINYYQQPLNFFNFLGENAHPKVRFTKLNLDLDKNIADISGKAADFEALGQQILILEGEKNIKGLNLSKVSIAKEGGIEFKLILGFEPQFFKYK